MIVTLSQQILFHINVEHYQKIKFIRKLITFNFGIGLNHLI
jgi:hypothetical protein